MDDFNVTTLYESKNEWASRLVNILTPLVSEGFSSILEESYKLCVENDEEEKTMMRSSSQMSKFGPKRERKKEDKKNLFS